jgi:hypothetical protein
MKRFFKRLLVMTGIGLLLMPAESDSGGSDSDSGGSDSGDSLTSSASASDSAQIAASIFSGDPTGRRMGSSDELSEGSSEASSEYGGDDTSKAKRRKSPQSTEGLSDEELAEIPE